MITLKKPERKLALDEIGQLVKYKFAFVTSKGELCHTPAMCRDFLQDALRHHFQDGESEIYGFSYKKGIDRPIEDDKTRLVVYNMTSSQMKTAVKIVNVFEKDAGFKPLTFAEGTTTTNVYVFEGPREWISGPFAISLYTFLIRLSHREPVFTTKAELVAWINSPEAITQKEYNDHDAEYLKATREVIWKIAPNLNKLSWKEVDYRQHHIYHFHNCSGIVSLARMRIKDKKVQKTIKTHILK